MNPETPPREQAPQPRKLSGLKLPSAPRDAGGARRIGAATGAGAGGSAGIRDGAKCRCPYCGGLFAWPPEGMRCHACGKAIRPPKGYAPLETAARRERVGEIRKAGDAARKRLGAAPEFRPAKNPGIYIGVIAALVVIGGAVATLSIKKEAEKTKPEPEKITRRELAIYAAALEHYKLDIGGYPSPRADGGLMALVSDPGEPDWHGRYVSGVVNDGWNRPYFYDLSNGVPLLISAGPDKKHNTEDDLRALPEDFAPAPGFIQHDPERKLHRPPPSVRIQ